MISMEDAMIHRLGVLMVLGVVVLLSGCGPARDYARVVKDFAVEQEFRIAKVSPDYRYYYNGPEVEPLAVLALDRNYTLQAKFWKEVDLDDARLQDWVTRFKQLHYHYDDIEHITIDYEGFEILSKDNERIGLVYSRYDWIVAWFGENNTITVTSPRPKASRRALGNMLLYRNNEN